MVLKLNESVIPKRLQDDIENIMGGTYFAWYHNNVTVDKLPDNWQWAEDEDAQETWQFVHTFYANQRVQSDHFQFVRPLLYFIENETGVNCNKLYRAKSNLLFPTGKDVYTTPHTDEILKNEDGSSKYKTILYYINDSDGDTVFFDQRSELGTIRPKMNIVDRMTPKKGSVVVFDSNIFHASTPPVNFKNRMVINFVVEVGD